MADEWKGLGLCRGIPCRFGLPKLRHGTAQSQDPVCPALPPRILYGKDGCGTDIPLIWVGKQAIKKETGKWYKRMTGNSFGIVLKREWAYSLVNRKAGGANLYGSLPPTLHIHPCYLFRLPLRVAVLLWVEELLQIEVVRFLLSAPTKRLSFLQCVYGGFHTLYCTCL